MISIPLAPPQPQWTRAWMDLTPLIPLFLPPVFSPSRPKLENETGLRIYAGIIDPELNDVGFIVPGVGDAGDRSFGT